MFSCIIPCSQKDLKSRKLQDLMDSIKAQDYPQEKIEILVVTQGDSEQAKAIGIKKAKGKICAMFCTDNVLSSNLIFSKVYNLMSSNRSVAGVYGKTYEYRKKDHSLNRYFSLIGNNDPIAFYLGKCDRFPIYLRQKEISYSLVDFAEDNIPSLGDNGFFYRKSYIEDTNLDHYYPMDNAEDLRRQGISSYWRLEGPTVWHRTSDNLISFLRKRYCYARDLYCDREDRRWKIIDSTKDKLRVAGFVLATITIIQPVMVSARGFFKARDFAWFWHPIVCWGFLITYGILALRNLKRYGTIFQKKCPSPA